MATTERKFFKNKLTEPLLNHKKWVRENPNLARHTEKSLDTFPIEVFGYNHEQVANDLHAALEKSGFLDKYALFSIKIEPIQ